jgi:hypothetical protein
MGEFNNVSGFWGGLAGLPHQKKNQKPVATKLSFGSIRLPFVRPELGRCYGKI